MREYRITKKETKTKGTQYRIEGRSVEKLGWFNWRKILPHTWISPWKSIGVFSDLDGATRMKETFELEQEDDWLPL